MSAYFLKPVSFLLGVGRTSRDLVLRLRILRQGEAHEETTAIGRPCGRKELGICLHLLSPPPEKPHGEWGGPEKTGTTGTTQRGLRA